MTDRDLTSQIHKKIRKIRLTWADQAGQGEVAVYDADWLIATRITHALNKTLNGKSIQYRKQLENTFITALS
jgi:hypothetical protein